ncbi:hypothetical protein [Paraburkholderia sp. BR14320]|uniref:hypothetical protein n=1 Tax=unclassified Paraburkholderia TaxID=2615204 RepID=UPI0034CFF782
MTMPVPVRVDRNLMRMLLRSEENAALLFGPQHAAALTRLLTVAQQHGQEVDVGTLKDGRKETLIARVAGAATWTCVR